MPRNWTPEERAAFGEKMKQARAAKAATAPEEGTMATEKKYAGPEDVPAGVRPIAARRPTGGVKDVAEVAGLVQAEDTGFAHSGAAIEVSGDVIGGGASVAPRPDFGVRNAGEMQPWTLFSDNTTKAGSPQEVVIPRRNSGRAEPTGLPCTCILPTYLRGEDPSITWCVNCGGERDGVARPENALRRSKVRDAMEQSGVTLSIDAIVARVVSEIDYGAIANEVVKQLALAQAAQKPQS